MKEKALFIGFLEFPLNKGGEGVVIRIHYNPSLKSFAKELRVKGVLSEVLLWQQLKGKKMKGFQFMRQKPIGNYIVDFFCSKLRLVIEIDGESHDGRFFYDAGRQQFLESIGLTVLRFNDADVKGDMPNIVMAIEGWIENNMKQPPMSPFAKGELQPTPTLFLRGNNKV